jgi:phosphoserine phosphatase RsbU/P
VSHTLSSIEVLDSLGYAYYELDLMGNVTYANSQFCREIGRTAEELFGKHYRHIVRRQDVALLFNIFGLIHKTGLPETNLIINFKHKNGRILAAEGSVALAHDKNGKPTGYRGILINITTRLQKEATLITAKKKAEKELEIARDIQASFLPSEFPQPKGWQIQARIRPAREVGGDFFDIFPLSAGKRIAIIVADVCDKGIGAAMYMAIFRSLFRAFSDQHYSLQSARNLLANEAATESGIMRRDTMLETGAPALKNAIELTNNYISKTHGDSNMFATVFFGLLDPEKGNLIYVNAGHEAALLVSGGSIKKELPPTGPAVGMMPDLQFSIDQVHLQSGDELVIYTDGVLDAQDSRQEHFGEERLRKIVTVSSSPKPTIDRILNELDLFTRRHAQFDDVTLLTIKRE